ncbi:hypothetical protein [Curtobacterium sp. NPDC092190]|uniref:hypothetical protein n=1 Tax=Curtobacterium sp. NPDC092190 TaxID=3363973 RepID=UPI00381981F9
MRPVEVFREARRDVCTGAAGALTCAVVLALLLCGVVGATARATVQDVRGAARFLSSGAATQVFTAAGRIDGRACQALTQDPRVVAAGAVRRVADGLLVSSLPGTAIPLHETTTGFPTVLGVEGRLGGPGVLLAPDVASALGKAAGDDLPVPQGSVPVAGIYSYPDDGRDPDLEWAVLAPAPDDGRPFDACWATVWPADDSASAALRRTLLPGTAGFAGTAGTAGAEGTRPTLGQLNPRSGATFEATAQLPAGSAETAALGVGLTVGVAAARRRRLVVASDRHVGVGVGAQAVSAAVQHLMWGVVAGSVATALAVVLVRGLSIGDAAPVVLHAAALSGLAVVGAVCGGIVGVASVRDRALHRYFRSR